MANVEDPVIGILTQPLSPLFMKKFPNKDYKGYVASSYVKWVELTGARAVVIPHFVDIKQIAELLTQIDGLVLPGGKTNLLIK
jgi:gamma-glutamyl-gamma-aminobutyrate hydrolase PuuD